MMKTKIEEMPKNLFEDLAKRQQKEELARMRILAKIKAKDIKGAHKIAQPYLKSIEEAKSSGHPIPTGWVRVCQILCAIDIQSHGAVNDNISQNNINDTSWIKAALSLVKERLEGVTRALVPTSLAIALSIQLLTPLRVEAKSPSAVGVIPNSIALNVENTTAWGKLSTQASSTIGKDNLVTKPELLWGVENSGNGKLIPKENVALLISTMHKDNEQKSSIKWELSEIVEDPKSGHLSAKLKAENTGRETKEISHFSMTDASYEGCSLQLSKNVAKEYNQYRSPAEIPPNSAAIYQVRIKKDSLPIIMFRTSDGETHSMMLRLPEKEKLEHIGKEGAWATYIAKNESLQDVEILLEELEGTSIISITALHKKGEMEYKKSSPLTLYPGNKLKVTVFNPTGSEPNLEAITTSRDATRYYTLSNKECVSLKDRLHRGFDMIINKIFTNTQEYNDWESVKTQYDKERSALIEYTGATTPIGGKLMEVSVTQNLSETIREDKLLEALKNDTPNKLRDDLLKIESSKLSKNELEINNMY